MTPEPTTSPTTQAPGTILLVDDHPPNLVVLEAVLTELGQPLQKASSGAEALRLLEQREYAVVLLDVRMPGISGLEVAARLRERSKRTPIIFITAADEHTELRGHGYDIGGVDFILKPYDPKMLRAKVRVFVELYQQREELRRLSALHEADRITAAHRVRMLAALASSLFRSDTTEHVARSAVDGVQSALGADVAALYLLGAGAEELALAAIRKASAIHAGTAPDLVIPAAHAVSSGQPLFLAESDLARATEHDGLALSPPAAERTAVVALPLSFGRVKLGALALGFTPPKPWDDAEKEFLLALATQVAAAVDRARLMDGERRAHESLRQQTQMLELLSEIGALLASSLDYTTILRQLAEKCVPVLADWCAVDVVNRDGKVERLAAYHSEPEKRALALELQRRYPERLDSTRGVPHVLRTGQTEWLPEIPEELLQAAARDEEHLRVIRSLGLKSYVVVPLQTRDRVLGALTLVYAESGRRYEMADVRNAEELGRRAALFVDNALLFKEQVDARERLERQSRQALLVGDVGAALTSSDDLQTALQQCTEAVVRHLGAAFARIWTLNEREPVLELRASAGLYTHLGGPHARVPVGKFKIGLIAEEAKPHFTNDVLNDPRVGDREWAAREGMVAFAGCPLLIEGRAIGVLAMFARSPLASDTLAALTTVADSIANGIDRARAARLAREERDTLEIVNRVGRAIAAELERDRLVQAVTDSSTRLAGAAFGAFLYNVTPGDGHGSLQYAVSGLSREAFASSTLPKMLRIFAPTLEGQSVVRIDDVREDPRYAGEAQPGGAESSSPVVSYLAVPVVSRTGKVLGGLFFGHPEPRAFGERSEMLVVGVAAQAAVAMDNARLFREAQKLIGELDKSNKDLDHFAYVASHDLKAPLRGIANLSQWVEEDLGDAVTPQAKEQLNLLRSRVHRMEALINGILDYSRAGRIRSSQEDIDIGQLLKDVVELLAPPPNARVEIGPDMPALRTERVPLQQVFMNLISNALKHAKREDPHVRITVKDGEEFLEFSVTDNGPGIAPEFHERIWLIFQTLEPRDSVEGTGIGLSVVKKIVERRGGRAWVESQAGAGATFKFTWPKHEQGNERHVG